MEEAKNKTYSTKAKGEQNKRSGQRTESEGIQEKRTKHQVSWSHQGTPARGRKDWYKHSIYLTPHTGQRSGRRT